ncbi:MAG: DUF4270 family protein [Bacteroidetes bacterium]|nr:MAG: DUF4270 family protein [Bacteroidota bacterium]
MGLISSPKLTTSVKGFTRWFPILTVLLSCFAACTKIETTTIGTGLIPAVDNINTFDTVLQVVSNNYVPDDSTRLLLTDAHTVGNIVGDPYFGNTNAQLFFETKPANSERFQFAPRDSIVGFDSAVMVLRYTGYFGDSSVPTTFKLYEVNQAMRPDTSIVPFYNLRPDLSKNSSKLWGQKTMAANRFRDTIEIKRKDSVYGRVSNELRIPISQALAQQLFFQDTLGAFRNDSAFKAFLPGFALEAEGAGNTLFYFSINQGTKLEFYYRSRIFGRIDTTSSSFIVSGLSGHANKITRNRTGAEIGNFLAQNPTVGASQVYVQATPGTMASIKIPGLSTLSNRIVHRAELRITELGVPSAATSQLLPPRGLYLDVAEPDNVFRGVPFDLSPFSRYDCMPQRDIDFSYFGGITNYEQVNGERVAVYRFALTRYIQNLVSKGIPVYDFRLSAPFTFFYKNCPVVSFVYPLGVYQFTGGQGAINRIADGRVRLAGGSHPNPQVRMQLRIIYSKL